jgi:hypothetical protein
VLEHADEAPRATHSGPLDDQQKAAILRDVADKKRAAKGAVSPRVPPPVAASCERPPARFLPRSRSRQGARRKEGGVARSD